MMGYLRQGCLALLVVCAATATLADCRLPPQPSKVPDAKTANDADMRSAMQTLKRYNVDVDAYLKCLAFEQKQGRLSDRERATLHNDALAKLKNAADLFNEQMRIYLGHEAMPAG